MILTIAQIADFGKFLDTFSSRGVEKRRQHGCRGSWVFRDPEDPNRVCTVFDWDPEDYQRFLTDPEVPAIAVELGVQGPPAKIDFVAGYDA